MRKTQFWYRQYYANIFYCYYYTFYAGATFVMPTRPYTMYSSTFVIYKYKKLFFQSFEEIIGFGNQRITEISGKMHKFLHAFVLFGPYILGHVVLRL